MLTTMRKRLSNAMSSVRERFSLIPSLAFQLGLLAAVLLEKAVGENFSETLGFRKLPKFFGIRVILEPFSDLDFSGILAPFFPSPTGVVDSPLKESGQAIGSLFTTFVDSFGYQGSRDPGFLTQLARVAVYDVVIFVIPVLVIALLLRGVLTKNLHRLPRWAVVALNMAVLYVIVALWGDDNGTRELVLIYMGINIMMSASLNLVNGYMGEFSVGHAGFMAVGAYASSILTMFMFTSYFQDPVIVLDDLSPALATAAQHIGFIAALILGGVAAALAGLLVAFPSFKTRGDYLAIVTLAVNFIVQGVIYNMTFVGGPRGLNGVPLWSNFHWVMIAAILSLVVIYLLVNSTFGKGITAIREDEIAAELMGVNTRRVKLVAFMVSSFIAGVAGGLLAHYLASINPSSFNILKSTESLVMVYLGGMGSISGSVIAAIIFTLLVEALSPLKILKWVVIPLILILLMLYRPQGLFGNREIKFNLLGGKQEKQSIETITEAGDAATGD